MLRLRWEDHVVGSAPFPAPGERFPGGERVGEGRHVEGVDWQESGDDPGLHAGGKLRSGHGGGRVVLHGGGEADARKGQVLGADARLRRGEGEVAHPPSARHVQEEWRHAAPPREGIPGERRRGGGAERRGGGARRPLREGPVGGRHRNDEGARLSGRDEAVELRRLPGFARHPRVPPAPGRHRAAQNARSRLSEQEAARALRRRDRHYAESDRGGRRCGEGSAADQGRASRPLRFHRLHPPSGEGRAAEGSRHRLGACVSARAANCNKSGVVDGGQWMHPLARRGACATPAGLSGRAMNPQRFAPVLAVALFTSAAALAQTSVDQSGEQLVESVAVRNRLYAPGGRWEIGPSVGFTVLTRLTDHYVFNLGAAYNFSDTLAGEIRGGYAYSRQTGLARQAAAEFLKEDPVQELKTIRDDFANLL